MAESGLKNKVNRALEFSMYFRATLVGYDT